MEKITVKIKMDLGASAPNYASEFASGGDLCALLSEPLTVAPGEIVLVPTGLYLELPEGVEAQVRSRSGLTLRHGIVVANGIGTIDSDYRGEIKVILTNISAESYTIAPGERIAQLVFANVLRALFLPVEVLCQSERGAGGFGHSGK